MIASKLLIGGTTAQKEKKVAQLIIDLYGFSQDRDLKKLQNSPDYFSLGNEGSVGIEEIRDLQRHFFLKPFMYKYKTCVVINAKAMTIPAQNAFLKTLEEPPEFCSVILVCDKKSDLLPTILSRCQIYIQSTGSYKLQKDTNFEKYLEFVDTIFQNDLGKKFALAEIWGKNKESAIDILEKLTAIFRLLLMQKFLPDAKPFITSSKNNSASDIIALLRQIYVTKRYIEANVAPRFALENLFLKC